MNYPQKPTDAFIGASWVALLLGAITYALGLLNSPLDIPARTLYFTLMMYGLFSAVSLQKSVRDRLEGKSVTAIYYFLCWVSVGLVFVLMGTSLWSAELDLSFKAFLGMAFALSLFGAVTVQKNVRDLEVHNDATFKSDFRMDIKND
jgi:uncharacterized membrane protein YiaA